MSTERVHCFFRPLACPLVFFLLCLTGCGSPFSGAPPVADSTFVSVLAELHLAEARLSLQQDNDPRRLRPKRSDTLSVPLPPPVRDSVLARHGMSYSQLRTALEYYVEHPEEYTTLYSRVVDTLNAEREAFLLDEGPQNPLPNELSPPEEFRK